MPKDLNQFKQTDTRIEVVTAIRLQRFLTKRVAKRYKLHPKSVPRICRRYKQRKTIERKRGSDRKSSLSKVDKQRIRNYFRYRPKRTAVDAQMELELSVTPQTVRNYLHTIGFNFKNPIKKLPLSQTQMQNRTEWAENHINTDFRRVLFSDEYSVWLNRFNGKCWARRNTRFSIFSPMHSFKIHLSGCISHKGPVSLYIFRPNLNLTVYKKNIR